jgi:hypothetical protein
VGAAGVKGAAHQAKVCKALRCGIKPVKSSEMFGNNIDD